MQEDEEAREEARAAEDALLERAAAIGRARDRAARQLPTAQEPKRGKAHWDFVLEEMAWMAKEFQRCAHCPATTHLLPSMPKLTAPDCDLGLSTKSLFTA